MHALSYSYIKKNRLFGKVSWKYSNVSEGNVKPNPLLAKVMNTIGSKRFVLKIQVRIRGEEF